MSPGRYGCDEIRHALGAYVLGAIDPAERAVVDRHIATCPACRDELAGLAGLPALLGRLSLAEVESLGTGNATGTGQSGQRPETQIEWSAAATGAAPSEAPGGAGHSGTGIPAEPPPALLRSILGEAARRRAHRRRAAVLAVAAAVVVLAGAGTATKAFFSGQAGPAAPRPPAAASSGWQRQATATDPGTKVTATVRYSAKSWGTAVVASVGGVPYGTRCVLWATDASGRHVEVASWTYATEGSWYPGSSSIRASAVTSFAITAGSRTLVTVPVS
jgi:anti-sigma factor RsiW